MLHWIPPCPVLLCVLHLLTDFIYREEDELYVSMTGRLTSIDRKCAQQHRELHQGGGEGVWRRTLGTLYYRAVGGSGVGVIELRLLALEQETLSKHTYTRICVLSVREERAVLMQSS